MTSGQSCCLVWEYPGVTANECATGATQSGCENTCGTYNTTP
jgi:hypothetical protein